MECLGDGGWGVFEEAILIVKGVCGVDYRRVLFM